MQTVAAAPARPARSSDGLRIPVALAQPTAALAGRGEATQLTVLVHRVTDPVGLGVAADRVVGGVDHDDLVVLVRGILRHPVRVEHAESTDAATDALLREGEKESLC